MEQVDWEALEEEIIQQNIKAYGVFILIGDFEFREGLDKIIKKYKGASDGSTGSIDDNKR